MSRQLLHAIACLGLEAAEALLASFDRFGDQADRLWAEAQGKPSQNFAAAPASLDVRKEGL